MSIRNPASAEPRTTDATQPTHYQLRLYTTGQSARSMTAIRNLQQMCMTHLDGYYEIEVIDLIENPKRAVEDQILAVPTLIRCLPLPRRRIVGDLSLTEKVLAGLDISPKASTP